MKQTKIKNKIIENFLARFKKKESKESVSFVEVPAQYETELFRTAQDRYHIVKEVNELCGENGDIRFQRANALIGEDATKGGFSIIINGSKKEKNRKQKQGKKVAGIFEESERVQKIVDDFLERTKLHILCTEHARALLREGDLFLNVIVDLEKGLITEIKRAPALTMKRNTDEYGKFIDNQKAFSQIDTSQIYQMAGEKAPLESRQDFALYQINHIRWLCDETKIYGTSQYAVARKCYKMLAKMEEALAYRRIYRSVSKRSHKLETTDIAEIEDYKRANAMVDENGTPTRNAHMLTDYIGNVEVSALHDEANLDEIKDVEMIENMLWINLLVPKAIITGGQGINRDVLKVQYPHYLQTLENITDRLEYGDNSDYSGYRAIIDLQLLLQGINPETIYYDIVWSRKTEESTAERIESIQNALAKSGGKQLISHEKAIQLVADDFDIEDPSMMYQKILEENGILKNQQEENTENTVKKNNIPSDAEAMIDEHEKDFEEMEKLSKDFTEKWKSFFGGVWEAVKESTEETIESKVKEAWQKQNKDFYINYIKKAYDLGEKRAESILSEILYDDIKISENDIGIEKIDIEEYLAQQSLHRVSKIEETTLKEIRNVLVKGQQEGKSWKAQKEKIQTVIQNPVRAEMIAITELSFAYNASIKNTYKGAGANKVVWHASIDIKTCDGCRALHGQEFDIDKASDNPLHPRCRCTWLPVFSSGKEEKLATENEADGSLGKAIKRNIKTIKRKVKNIETMAYSDLPENIKASFEKGLQYANTDTRTLLERQMKKAKFSFVKGKNAYNRKYDYIKLEPNPLPSTIAHETFHRIDNENGITQERILVSSLQQDYERILFLSEGNIKQYLKKHYKNAISYGTDGEMILKDKYRGISDIFSGLTKNKVFLGHGHRNKYWNADELNVFKEAWAQYGRITYDNDKEVLEMFAFLFPDFYQSAIILSKKLL